MAFQLLAETISQPRKPAHLHPARQIEPLDIRRADILAFRDASYHGPIHARDVTRAVAMRRIRQARIADVFFCDLSVIDSRSKYRLDSADIGRVAI